MAEQETTIAPSPLRKWARIEGADVVEIIDFDPKDKFHPDMVFVEVPAGLVDIINEDFTIDETNGKFVNSADKEEALRTMREVIAATRWEVQQSGVVINDHTYHSDKDSVAAYNNKIAIGREYEAINGPSTYKTTWKTRDGAYLELALSDLQTIAVTVDSFLTTALNREAEIVGLVVTAFGEGGAQGTADAAQVFEQYKDNFLGTAPTSVNNEGGAQE